MSHLIDKDAVVAEIERKIHNIDYEGLSDRNIGQKQSLYHILSFLNTLEVKEVDLEKELDKYYGVYRDKSGLTYDIIDNERCFDWKEDGIMVNQAKVAKHFFELGLKAQKGGMIEALRTEYEKGRADVIAKACSFLHHYQEYPNHDIVTDKLVEAFKMYIEL